MSQHPRACHNGGSHDVRAKASSRSLRNEPTVTLKLKEPWKGFLESDDFVLGAAEQNLLNS